MRVVHVLPTYDFAGPSNVCFGICRGLMQAGVDTDIISLRPPDPAALPRLVQAGIECHSLNMGGLWDRRPSDPLRELFRDLAPDVVHGHGLRPDALVAPVARGSGVPLVVSTVHCSLLEDYGMAAPSRAAAWAAYLWQRRALQRYTDAVVFVSRAARQSVTDLRWFPLRHPCLRVIHNGVPAAELLSPAEVPEDIQTLRASGRPLVGHVGVLIARKNVAALLQAVARNLEAGLDCDTVVVGDGEERVALEALAGALGLADRVHFLGRRQDVPGILAGLDVLALPSLSEGVPLALLEALLAGLPVVATRVGGVPEVVTHDQTGLLVPPGDVAALAEQLGRLLADPELRIRLGQAAHVHAASSFTDIVMGSRYLALYQELLDDRARRR